ncbi:MAG: PAS domain S-box protein, partial [Desulfobacterales bacterium]|nr:PAS domain S-box protein [Desulfobacterales bacterium]
MAGNPTHEELEQRVKELEKQAVEHRRVEETLRESEGRLQAILDNTTAAIYLKDTRGRYMLANRHFEILSNMKREDVIGKTDYDIFPKEIA